MSGEFVSPRKIAEQERDYKRSRFEWYMDQADAGKIPRALAITALQEEIANIADLSTGPEQQPIA